MPKADENKTLKSNISEEADNDNANAVLENETDAAFSIERDELGDENLVSKKYSDSDSARAATESERNILIDIKDGLKRKYKIFAWTLEGELNMEKYRKAYNELFYKNSSLRVHYVSDDVNAPVCFVEKNKDRIFRLMDLRTTPEEGQKIFIQNSILALSRENYNPETDLPIKLHVYLLGNKTIEVILALYTYWGNYISADDIRRNIFMGLKTSGTTPMQFIEEEKSEQIVYENNKKCFDYWKKEILPVGKKCTVPFSCRKEKDEISENYVLEYNISDDVSGKLTNVIIEKGFDYESLILFAYSKLIGEYNENNNPVLFVKDALSLLSIKPIKVRNHLENSKCVEDIFRQLEYGKSFTDCAFGDFCSEFDLDKRRDFELLFDFVNEDESDNYSRTEKALKKINAGNNMQFSPRLEICTIFSRKDKTLKIRYTYEIDGISEDTIKMIHDSFIKALDELILVSEKFEWKKYISEYKDDTEKLRKLNIAQKALYIKEGDFLVVNDARDVLLLAEKSKVGTYVAEECLYSEGKNISHVGILIDGHIEERYVGIDGITKILSVYKKGYMIGLEAFTDNPKSDFSYFATDSSVKIIWIPISELMRVMSRDSVSYCNLLKKSLNETKRIKKLWSLQ